MRRHQSRVLVHPGRIRCFPGILHLLLYVRDHALELVYPLLDALRSSDLSSVFGLALLLRLSFGFRRPYEFLSLPESAVSFACGRMIVPAGVRPSVTGLFQIVVEPALVLDEAVFGQL